MKFKYVLCAMIISLAIPTFTQSVNIVTNGTKIYEEDGRNARPVLNITINYLFKLTMIFL